MCMMLYIGADNELPIDSGDLIYLGNIHEANTAIKKHFTKKFNYSVFTRAGWGCACGFNYDMGNELFEFINKYVADDNCELVSSWTGEEESEIECKEIININEFYRKKRFDIDVCRPDDFPLGKYIKVIK